MARSRQRWGKVRAVGVARASLCSTTHHLVQLVPALQFSCLYSNCHGFLAHNRILIVLTAMIIYFHTRIQAHKPL